MHYVHLIASCFVSAHLLVVKLSPFRVYAYFYFLHSHIITADIKVLLNNSEETNIVLAVVTSISGTPVTETQLQHC